MPRRSSRKRGSGTTRGTIRRCPTGSSTARCSTRRSSPRRRRTALQRGGSTAGRASAVAMARARTSGIMPMPWRDCSPNWNAICGSGPTSARRRTSAQGMIQHRGESCGLAVDGQAGCILRAYREHQMSRDGAMLTELWPRIKLAMQCLINMDRGEGLIEGAQHNTLDQPWFGKIAWLSSLYLAALRACEEMAREVGDAAFAKTAREIFGRGSRNLDRELFNGEYYYPDSGQGSRPQRRLAQRLRNRPGIRTKLGFPGFPGANPFREERPAGVGVALEVQLCPGRRALPPGPPAGPLVRDGRRGRAAHVQLAQGRGGACGKASTITSTSA